MKVKSAVSLAAIALVLVLGIAYMAFGVLKYEPLKEFTTLRMQLPTSGGLGPRSQVLLSGVEVGKVVEVAKVADGVEATVRIESRFKIPVDSMVRIENLSALGEPYVVFAPAGEGGPYFENDQVIASRHIQAPVSIPDLSLRVVDVIEELDPKVVRSLVDGFSTAIQGTANEVPRLERSTKLLAAMLLSRTDAIRQLLVHLQTIAGDMSWLGPSLESAGPWWHKMGIRFDEAVRFAGEGVVARRDPREYVTGDGLGPTLRVLDEVLHKTGPGLAELAPVLAPMTAQMTSAIGRIDIATLLGLAVRTVGDGAINLHIGVK